MRLSHLSKKPPMAATIHVTLPNGWWFRQNDLTARLLREGVDMLGRERVYLWHTEVEREAGRRRHRCTPETRQGCLTASTSARPSCPAAMWNAPNTGIR